MSQRLFFLSKIFFRAWREDVFYFFSNQHHNPSQTEVEMLECNKSEYLQPMHDFKSLNSDFSLSESFILSKNDSLRDIHTYAYLSKFLN